MKIATIENKANELVQQKLSGFFHGGDRPKRHPLEALINAPQRDSKHTQITKNQTKPHLTQKFKPKFDSPKKSIKSKCLRSKSSSLKRLYSALHNDTKIAFRSVKTVRKALSKRFASLKGARPILLKELKEAPKKPTKSLDWVKRQIKCKRGHIFPEISAEQLVRALRGDLRNCFDRIVVVDCRFDYEFDGGHIRGAVNVNTKEGIHNLYKERSSLGASTAFVFHCEFSSQRAPALARCFRQFDRQHNDYPAVRFPLVFVLGGGYKAFFSEGCARALCLPRGYVSMFAGPAKP